MWQNCRRTVSGCRLIPPLFVTLRLCFIFWFHLNFYALHLFCNLLQCPYLLCGFCLLFVGALVKLWYNLFEHTHYLAAVQVGKFFGNDVACRLEDNYFGIIV